MRIKVLILLASLLSYQYAEACSCIIITDFAEADKVVTGKILKIERVRLPQIFESETDTIRYDIQLNKCTVSVVETFKGKKTEKKIFIYTGALVDDDCDYRFAEGKAYIIYATKERGTPTQNLPKGPLVYFTSDCSDTVPYDKKRAESLRK